MESSVHIRRDPLSPVALCGSGNPWVSSIAFAAPGRPVTCKNCLSLDNPATAIPSDEAEARFNSDPEFSARVGRVMAGLSDAYANPTYIGQVIVACHLYEQELNK